MSKLYHHHSFEHVSELTASGDLLAELGLSAFKERLSIDNLPPAFGHLLNAREKPRQADHLAIPASLGELARSEPTGRPLEHFYMDQLKRSMAVSRLESSSMNTNLPSAIEGASSTPSTRKRERVAEKLSPRSELKRLILPIFNSLWRMNFGPKWGNPFKIIITRETCASLGIPTYFDYIDEPMNLTWIKDKVEKKEYEKLSEFKKDVYTIVNNAQTFNRQGEDVHAFAQRMKDRFDALVAAIDPDAHLSNQYSEAARNSKRSKRS